MIVETRVWYRIMDEFRGGLILQNPGRTTFTYHRYVSEFICHDPLPETRSRFHEWLVSCEDMRLKFLLIYRGVRTVRTLEVEGVDLVLGWGTHESLHSGWCEVIAEEKQFSYIHGVVDGGGDLSAEPKNDAIRLYGYSGSYGFCSEVAHHFPAKLSVPLLFALGRPFVIELEGGQSKRYGEDTEELELRDRIIRRLLPPSDQVLW